MEFYAGSEHTARAVMHNPTSMAFGYLGVLFMGIGQASMVEVNFHLEAGESKEVLFPITMPTALGDYPVYVGVFSGGTFLEPLRQGENVAIIAQAGPFDMSITKFNTTADKYGPAFWLMQPTAVISNPHSVRISHQIRIIAAPGSYDQNLLSSYIWTRCWGGGAAGASKESLQELLVTLDPGQSITLVSPFYYIDEWHSRHENYEWSNMPPGTYSSGTPRKYWFRVIDEQGNWSPVASIGTVV